MPPIQTPGQRSSIGTPMFGRRAGLRALLLPGVVGAALLLSGCRSEPTPVEWAQSFPEGARQSRSLDVQVFRRTTSLSLTNTSTRTFGPSRVWLNKQFSLPIDGLAVGQTLDLDLRDFLNEHSESFRAGGFFAIDRPKQIAIVQLETPRADGNGSDLLGLVLVADEME